MRVKEKIRDIVEQLIGKSDFSEAEVQKTNDMILSIKSKNDALKVLAEAYSLEHFGGEFPNSRIIGAYVKKEAVRLALAYNATNEEIDKVFTQMQLY